MDLTTLLILIGIAIVLAIVVIIRRKIIIMSLIRMRYGQYSNQFVDKYKSYYKMNPFPHAAKSEMTEYLDFFNKAQDVTKIQTNIRILFDSLQVGIKVRNIVETVGNPDYFSIRKIGKHSVKIYGYDVIIFDLKAVALYFLLDDMFFLGEFTIRRDKQSFDFETISKYMKEKYSENSDVLLNKSFRIDDQENRSIFIHDDGFAVRLKYFKALENSTLTNLLEEHMKIKSSFNFTQSSSLKANY